VNEHDYEPVAGLPAPLPDGETILWQGAPDWRTFARRAMRVRVVSGYFVLLAIWGIAARISSGMPLSEVALSTLRWSSLAAIAIALLVIFSWLVARTTLYTVTSRRVVVRFGIALPITIQIPFHKIEAAGARIWPDGTGDITLSLMPGQRIGYLIVWPHARPWKMAKTQPALRGIPHAAEVAQALARALAASALQPAKAISVPVADAAGAGAHVAAAA
jgi:Bacterial PH domain